MPFPTCSWNTEIRGEMKNKVIDNLIIKPGLFKLLVRLTDVCLFLYTQTLYTNQVKWFRLMHVYPIPQRFMFTQWDTLVIKEIKWHHMYALFSLHA